MDEPRSISLFRRYRAGDQAALEDLLNRYLPRVFRIVRASLSGELKSKLEADDVVQVVMMRAVESLDSFEFREDAALVKWMARIARNEIIHQARMLQSVKRDPRREMSLDLSVTSRAPLRDSLPTDSVGPLERVEADEAARVLDDCICELSERHREVILARDYAGGSWTFVTEEVGAPSVDAAKQLHRRARAQLTEIVKRRLA